MPRRASSSVSRLATSSASPLAERLTAQPTVLGYVSTVEAMSVTRMCALVDAHVMEAAKAAGMVDEGRMVAALREARMDPRAAARAVEDDLRRLLPSVESSDIKQVTTRAPVDPLARKPASGETRPLYSPTHGDVAAVVSAKPASAPRLSNAAGNTDPLAGWYWQKRSESASRGADDALHAMAHHSMVRQLDAEYEMRRRELMQQHEQDGRTREQLRRSLAVEAQERREIEQELALSQAEARAIEMQVQNDARVDGALKTLMESVALCQRELAMVEMLESAGLPAGTPSLRTSSYFCSAAEDDGASGDASSTSTPLVRLQGELSELSRTISTTLEASKTHKMELATTSSTITPTPRQSSQLNGSRASALTKPPPSPTANLRNPDSPAIISDATPGAQQRRRTFSPGRRADTMSRPQEHAEPMANQLSPTNVRALSPTPRTTSSRPPLAVGGTSAITYALVDGLRAARARSPILRPRKTGSKVSPRSTSPSASPSATAPSSTPASRGTPPGVGSISNLPANDKASAGYIPTAYELLERQEKRRVEQRRTRTQVAEAKRQQQVHAAAEDVSTGYHPGRRDQHATTTKRASRTSAVAGSRANGDSEQQPQPQPQPDPEPEPELELEPEPQQRATTSSKQRTRDVDGNTKAEQSKQQRQRKRRPRNGSDSNSSDEGSAEHKPVSDSGKKNFDSVALPEAALAFDADGNGVLDGAEVTAMLEAMGELAHTSKQPQRVAANHADAARGRSRVSPQKGSTGSPSQPDPARSSSASRESPQPVRVTSAEVAEQAAKAVAATEQPLWPYPRTMEQAVAEAMQEAAALAKQRADMTNKVTEAVAASSTAAAHNRDRNREAARQRRQSQKLHDPNQGYRSRG